jgi:hypothetical protein
VNFYKLGKLLRVGFDAEEPKHYPVAGRRGAADLLRGLLDVNLYGFNGYADFLRYPLVREPSRHQFSDLLLTE